MTISMDDKELKWVIGAVHPTYANNIELLAKVAIAKRKATKYFPLDVGCMTILFEADSKLFLGTFSANGKKYNFKSITQIEELKDLCDRHYHSRAVENFSHLVK